MLALGGMLCAGALAELAGAHTAPGGSAQSGRSRLAAAREHLRSRRAAIPLSVSLAEVRPGPPVPAGFLGLSFEVAALGQLASYAGTGDLVTMLRSLGAGVLRFGGVTADEDFAWSEPGMAAPSWASGGLEAGELDQLGALAARSGWHVLLTLGFGHYEPLADAREAAAAEAALGPSLQAIELGNEPNSYSRHGLRPQPWTFVQYEEQVSAARGAIDVLAPGIPLAGPDTSGSSAYEKWGLGEVVDQRPALLTGHHYPLGCGERPSPSIAHLLSPQIRQAEEVSLRRYVFAAEQGEVPFRMDETNTVSCGGVPGVSNTFASALWALSYMTKAMSMGVAGMNFQGNPLNCLGYTPLCTPTPQAAVAGALTAQPEWYALLMARALLGERPLRTSIVSPDHANVVVSAFAAPDGALRFVLVNDDPPGDHDAAVSLHVGRGFHGATVLALAAPAPEATGGVTLGGRSVSPEGQWTQPSGLPRVPNRRGVITALIPPSSAALLTVSPLAR